MNNTGVASTTHPAHLSSCSLDTGSSFNTNWHGSSPHVACTRSNSAVAFSTLVTVRDGNEDSVCVRARVCVWCNKQGTVVWVSRREPPFVLRLCCTRQNLFPEVGRTPSFRTNTLTAEEQVAILCTSREWTPVGMLGRSTVTCEQTHTQHQDPPDTLFMYSRSSTTTKLWALNTSYTHYKSCTGTACPYKGILFLTWSGVLGFTLSSNAFCPFASHLL